ncbi:flagellin [Rhodanobacter sp. Root480]|uniref:flagellin N-terminal helical domain-containing protein n=1 Tax=Rhodanobacter sp. Root480 TaxID=1736542 RepID=UPI001F3A6C8C|nr:flagellin [Rhodanobacter sp. Root480]
MSVITNISSLNAQKNLATSQSKLSTAIERLSSGMRINSAKDDAAGLAISTRFTTQINGLNQAVANASDGISLAQTTESALNEVTNNMQRIRTLAVQSANATNSDSDRAALDAEVQQRLAEITRISTQTTFNGRHVLDGSFGTAAFQIGANVGETISVNLEQGAGASQIGLIAKTGSSAAFSAGVKIDGDLVVNLADGGGTGVATTANVAKGTYTSVEALATAINEAVVKAGGTGTVATVDATTGNLVLAAATTGGALTYTGAQAAAGKIGTTALATGTVAGSADSVGDIKLAANDLTFQVGDGSAVALDAKTYHGVQELADAINSKGLDGLHASVDADNKLQLTSQETLVIGGSAAGATASKLTAGSYTPGGSLAGASIKTVAGANETISRIDSALSTISAMRSDLGAVQNRFTSTIANLQTISQNLSASRSQIQDADFAAETANMSSANILQQAGVSVLAQANASTQSVLKLLQ